MGSMDFLAEYACNTGYHSSLQAIPFEVVYGKLVPKLFSYCSRLSKLEAVDCELKDRDKVLHPLQAQLLQLNKE